MSVKNLEAEESALGAMMWNPEFAGEIAQQLQPEDFWNEKHRIIFRAAAALLQRGGSSDTCSVVAELQRMGELEAAGDEFYIISLADSVPSGAMWAHYCACVLEASARRQIEEIGPELGRITGGQEIRDALDQAGEELHAVSRRLDHEGPAHISDGVRESVARMMQARQAGRSVIGLETGWGELDRLTGGLQPGNLIIIGGRTSMGKTSLALNIVHHLAVEGDKKVLIFSLEMNHTEISDRLICQESRINSAKYRIGDLHELEMRRADMAQARIAAADILVDPRGGQSVEQMRIISRQKRPDLVIVDYIQLMYGGRKEESRTQEISRFARDLKLLAMELNIPVLAVSQLRRMAQGQIKKNPTLEDLKESGGIEQNADMVILLYRAAVDGVEQTEGEAEIHLAKNRNGRTGKVTLFWVGGYTTFLDEREGK